MAIQRAFTLGRPSVAQHLSEEEDLIQTTGRLYSLSGEVAI